MNQISDPYDIVIFGNYTKDTIINKAGRHYLDGGGFNYGAHAARVFGLKIAAVTRLAKEDIHVVRKLEKIGIDVFPLFTPSSTHMELEYQTSNVDDRILRCAVTAGSYTPDQFERLEAKAFIMNGSIRGEIPYEVVDYLKSKKTLIVADLQGFIRIVGEGNRLYNAPWPEKEKYLRLFDVLKTDAVEAESLTGETNISKAAKIISSLGPSEVVLTHRKGILVYASGEYHEAGFNSKSMIGRSGRGDTCLASYVSKRLTEPPGEAIKWSAALTSLKMEKEGPFLGSIDEVKELIKSKYRD